MEVSSKYSTVTQIVHWVSAVLILCMIPLGLVMHNLADGTQKQVMYNVHVTIGVVVIAVTVFRLVWLAFHRWPEPLPRLSAWRLKFLTAIHVMLYVVLVVVLLSGVAMILSSGMLPIPGSIRPEDIQDVVPRTVHDLLSKVLILCLIIHVVGVIDYQIRKGDALSRMGISLPSRSN